MGFKGTAKLNYYKNNCEEELIKTPISVLRYIGILETHIEESKAPEMLEMLERCRQLTDSKILFDEIEQIIKEATEINP